MWERAARAGRRVRDALMPLASWLPGPALEAFRQYDRNHQVDRFLGLLTSTSGDPFHRGHPGGHFTGSAFLVSGDGERTALMLHRKLGRWLQPGGHSDGDRNLPRVALREAGEETGLSGLDVEPAIFDLDRHWIPDRPGEPGHWHYDVRFVVRGGADETLRGNGESVELAWWPIAETARSPTIDDSLRRMARRWLSRMPAR